MGSDWSCFHPFAPELNQGNQRSSPATYKEGKVVHEGMHDRRCSEMVGQVLTVFGYSG